MSVVLRRIVFQTGLFVFSLIFLPIVICAAAVCRALDSNSPKNRLVWGSVPILNNSYWSRAMKDAGFLSETFTGDFFSLSL